MLFKNILPQSFFLLQAVISHGKAPFTPHSSARRVVWIWNEVGELLCSRLPACRSFREAARTAVENCQELLTCTDAVLDASDPLPFLGLHYMQVGLITCKIAVKRH